MRYMFDFRILFALLIWLSALSAKSQLPPAVLHILSGHTGLISLASFSPDGSLIVTASGRTAKVWDADTGQLIHTLEGHADEVWSASFSPDSSLIVTASWDQTAKIWDAASGELIDTLAGHTNLFTSAFLSPDGSRIVTASSDYTAKVWILPPDEDAEDWRPIKERLTPYLEGLEEVTDASWEGFIASLREQAQREEIDEDELIADIDYLIRSSDMGHAERISTSRIKPYLEALFGIEFTNE